MYYTGAGLTIFTVLEQLGLVALLQRRGIWNLDKPKNGYKVNYPGTCQGTIFGAKEAQDNDQWLKTILREADQEVGPQMCTFLERKKDTFVELFNGEFGNKHNVIMGIFVEKEELPTIYWEQKSGGLELMTTETTCLDVNESHKHTIIPAGKIGMFEYDFMATSKGLDVFAQC